MRTQKMAICQSRRKVSAGIKHWKNLEIGLFRLQNCEKVNVVYLYTPPRLWYFVIAAPRPPALGRHDGYSSCHQWNKVCSHKDSVLLYLQEKFHLHFRSSQLHLCVSLRTMHYVITRSRQCSYFLDQVSHAEPNV